MTSAVDHLASLENTGEDRINTQSIGHIPGYQGYCPQFKYRYGKTYGRQTYELGKEPKEPEESTALDYRSVWQYRKSLSNSRLEAAAERDKLERSHTLPPLATGDNTRYTRNMIPGYTGYVPRWPFKFGSTYRNETDICLDEFGAIQRINEFDRRSALVYPRCPPDARSIGSDPAVLNYLSITDRTNSGQQPLDVDPPIPGYKGFIPHVRTSDIGLGLRFRNMARDGYEAMSTQRYQQDETKRMMQAAAEACNRYPTGSATDRSGLCSGRVTSSCNQQFQGTETCGRINSSRTMSSHRPTPLQAL